MRIADSFQRNGALTAAELRTFLKGTPYTCFADWMLSSPLDEYSKMDNFQSTRGNKRFTQFDLDGNGSIQLPELRRAVSQWLIWEAKQAGGAQSVAGSSQGHKYADSTTGSSDTGGRRLRARVPLRRSFEVPLRAQRLKFDCLEEVPAETTGAPLSERHHIPCVLPIRVCCVLADHSCNPSCNPSHNPSRTSPNSRCVLGARLFPTRPWTLCSGQQLGGPEPIPGPRELPNRGGRWLGAKADCVG